jgi:hypothetical protein
MKKTSFTRQNIKTLRNEINKALASLGKKHNIEFSLGAIRFDSAEFRVKLTGTADKSVVRKRKQEQMAKNFKFWDAFSGFEKSDLGRTFSFRGTEYKVLGWNHRAKTKNIKLERTRDGKTFKCSPADLKIFFKG